MKYTIEGTCGHTYVVDLIGPHKTREWKLEKLRNSICENCQKELVEKERERENLKAIEKSKEMELPTLEGSPKQVSWANSIKIKMLEEMTEKLENISDKNKDAFWEFMQEITNNKSATFFIDNRYSSIDSMFKEYKKSKSDRTKLKEIEDETTAAIKPDMPTKPGIVEIVVSSDKIFAIYSKDQDFINICKSIGFKWNGRWERTITQYNGGPQRAIELGYLCLKNGFSIKADKSLIQDMVIGNYEKECTKWIGIDEKKIIIRWNSRSKASDEYYRESKKIHGSKWENGRMTVPASSFEEIRDFAEVNGFKITKDAEMLMQDAEEARNKIETVAVEERKEEKAMSKEEILNSKMSNDGIITDLLDEEPETDIDKINNLGYSIVKGLASGKKIIQDQQGRAVSVWSPDGSLKTIHAKSFDREITFAGKVKIKLRELVRYVYGYDDEKLLEVERRMKPETYDELEKERLHIGLISTECEPYGEIPEGAKELTVSHYQKNNIGIKLCTNVDEWFLWIYEFDHVPSVEDIEDAFAFDMKASQIRADYIA